jgi:hypothetical protein
MNLDDETLLTAYLDGELDDAGRNRVEAATLASPGLARRLRDLAEARDLVEGLSRPSPLFDVSTVVLARISAPPRPWAFRVRVSRVVSPRWLALGSGLAAAASLLITLSLTQFGQGDQPLRHATEDRQANADRKPSSPPSHTIVAVSPTKDASAPASTSSSRIEVAAADPAPPRDAVADAHHLQDQERLRGLLDRGDVRKIRLPVDRLGGDDQRKLELAIEQTHRKYPAKGQITVAPGVIIDPRAARGAIVYALLLDDDELVELQGNLVSQFGTFDQPAAAEPAEVLLLADQSHVSFSVPYGTVVAPPGDIRPGPLAIRNPDRVSPAHGNDGGSSLPNEFTVRPPRREPTSPPTEAAKTPSAPESRRLATVLIWLAPRHDSSAGRPK